jgi:hypothetical protein
LSCRSRLRSATTTTTLLPTEFQLSDGLILHGLSLRRGV